VFTGSHHSPQRPRYEYDDGNLAGGLGLVTVQQGIGGSEELIQAPALRLVSDDRDGTKGPAPDLDGNVGIRD
jgi:hypothetical protein